MQRFALRLLVNALAVPLASLVLPGILRVESPGGAFAFALVLGLVNAFVRPVVLLLALPLTLLSLGLFTFVLNTVVFWIATQAPAGVRVAGFGGAFWGALGMTAVSFLASRALR